MRKLIIVKIDTAGGRRKLDCCDDAEIAIAPILIGPTTTGANLRKLRTHDRAVRALIYELVISVILLTTLTCPDLLRVVYFAVTHFADECERCGGVVDPNRSAGRSWPLRGFSWARRAARVYLFSM